MGDLTAVASDGGRCTVWNSDIGQDVAAPTDTGAAYLFDDIRSVAVWHPLGNLLATTDGEGARIIWQPDIAEKFTTLAGHTDVVTGVAWSSDGIRIATVNNDEACIIWSPHTTERILTLIGHIAAVAEVTWSPNGIPVATSSNDRACVIWNPHVGQKLITIIDHARAMSGTAQHPDGDPTVIADTSELIRTSHLDGALECAFMSV